jgi:outer membrane protein assembly factor BamE
MIKTFTKIFFAGLICFLTLSCVAGCSCLKPYRVPVQQGNILEANAVHKLKIGMTKDEVIDVIGAPVLSNAFAENYWTYIYTNQINGGKIEKKELVLWFSNNRLVKIIRKNA